MLRTFVGYKGRMAAAKIGRVEFVILAKDKKQLSVLWRHILGQVALDPAGVKDVILIEASVLPERAAEPQSPEILKPEQPPEDPRQFIMPVVAECGV